MRRTTGVIALLLLLLGVVWLVWNGYDRAAGPETTVTASSPDTGEAAAPAESASAENAPSETETPAQPEDAAAANSSGEAEGAAGESSAETAPAGPVPSFDIVRVEPSGETVIAGLASPGATVEVLDGAESRATAEANERGEWALVLDEPLTPGSHDLAIRTTSPDKSEVTLSDQRIAISVPDSPDEAPLVVLNAPDAPSRVIQMPSEQQLASNEAPASPSQSVPQESSPGAEASAPAEGEADVAAPPPAASPAPSTDAGSDASVESSPAAPSTAEAEAESAPSADAADSAADRALDSTDSPSAARANGSEASVPETPPAATPGETAGNEAGEAPPTPGIGEAEGEEQSEGEGGPALAETPSDEGEAPSAPSAGSDTASAPPAVPPEPGPDAQSEAPSEGEAAPSGSEPSIAEAPEPAPATAEPVEPAPPAAEVAVAAVEAETDGTLYIAGTATTAAPVRVYVDDAFVGEAKPSETGTWLIETERELPAGTYSVRVDQVGEGGGVVARAEVPFERQIDVATLRPTSDASGDGSAEISGAVSGPATVIIKRGDNLWRISRAMYGRGIRYSTIYQANLDQIRDPDLIYPGQVFVLPQGDAAWSE